MSTKLEVRPLTGWSGDEKYFDFHEYQEFVPEAVLDVLEGRVAGVIFRGMVPADVCTNLSQRFWDSPARKTRGVEAPGYYLGAYTWNKPTAQYLDESAEVNPALRELLDVPGNPMKVFYDGLGRVLAERGARVRPSVHDGRESCLALLRSWHGRGTFALAPHDDDSQCSDPQMADFERNGVFGRPVAALNICLQNEGPAAGWRSGTSSPTWRASAASTSSTPARPTRPSHSRASSPAGSRSGRATSTCSTAPTSTPSSPTPPTSRPGPPSPP